MKTLDTLQITYDIDYETVFCKSRYMDSDCLLRRVTIDKDITILEANVFYVVRLFVPTKRLIPVLMAVDNPEFLMGTDTIKCMFANGFSAKRAEDFQTHFGELRINPTYDGSYLEVMPNYLGITPEVALHLLSMLKGLVA